MMRMLTPLAFILASVAAPVAASDPGDIAEVRNGLLAVAIGNEIQENCSSIEPRMFRVYLLRNELIDAARDAGFSDAEIEAYVDDRAERDYLEGMAAIYLANNGVERTDPDSYCSVGAVEISKNTAVGRLLREN